MRQIINHVLQIIHNIRPLLTKRARHLIKLGLTRHLQILNKVQSPRLNLGPQFLKRCPDLTLLMSPIINNYIKVGTTRLINPRVQRGNIILIPHKGMNPLQAPLGHALLDTISIILCLPQFRTGEEMFPQRDGRPWSVSHIAPQSNLEHFHIGLLEVEWQEELAVHDLVTVCRDLVGGGAEGAGGIKELRLKVGVDLGYLRLGIVEG
mmetsp:Transcript_22160/g.40685  ORF Transcript_22160/g.40685 Transcript_22160/m.40685 type:complete len:207 (-) Transcript_22160:174-794(-)